MPLITRRSSTRALPRVSVGRCGLIFENCAFVSQNCSRLIYDSFSEAVNHATTLVPTLLWGPDPKNSGADSAIYAIFGCCLFRLRIAEVTLRSGSILGATRPRPRRHSPY